MGFSKAEFTNSFQAWESRVHPDDLEEFRKVNDDVLYHGKNLFSLEYRILNKAGIYCWVHCRGKVMDRSQVYQPLRIIGTIEDITDRKNREDDLHQKNIELEGLFYIASHDLQEPLRMVSGFVELLRKYYNHKLDSRANEYIDYAVKGAERMQQLIHDVLIYASAGNDATYDETKTTEILKEIAEDFVIQPVKINFAYNLPNVQIAKFHLKQILQNLISNGIKYNRSTIPKVTVTLKENVGHWIFSVKDNGIGICPEHMKKIFHIFVRLHTAPEYVGHGIGLAICKKIVQKYHGEIWAVSTPDQGSEFFFTIPKHQIHLNSVNPEGISE